jgi:hypothetical protein
VWCRDQSAASRRSPSQIIEARSFEAGEVVLGRLVEACGDAAPVLHPVDQSLDSVATTVKTGVESDGTAVPAALLLAVGHLVLMLRDERSDAAFAQLGVVGAGRVRLVRGN